MSVSIKPYEGKCGGWEVDIRLKLPSGKQHRERRVITHRSKSAANRWADDRLRHLLQNGPDQVPKEVFTLEEFAPMRLIRFGGHLWKGDYDVHSDGRDDQERPASPAAI